MKKLAALTLSLFLTTGTAFADSPKDTPKAADAQPAKTATAAKPATAKTNAEIAAEMEELRQALQAQQEQLQLLKEELAKRDRQIEEAREAAAAANSRATEANAKATEAAATSAEVKTTTTALNSSVATLAASNAAVSASDEKGGEEKGPSTIRYKGVSITPGGFLAAETAFRAHATGGGIATPFTSTPFAAADIAHVTENAFSGRQSRLSMLVQSKVGVASLSGYVEADFLGVGTTSNNRQTNSYVFRQRQLFAQAAFDNGLTVTGGQMWSLAMENKKGIAARGENTPMQIDPNYVVGMTWARQYGFRITKSFGDKFAVAFSVEGPQATIGGRGFSAVTTINSAAAPATILTSCATTATTWNFFLNAPGAGGGLMNAFDGTGYTVNKAPDFIFKAAADPGFGHYEIFGIVSVFRDRIYPCGVVGSNLGDTVPGTTTFTGNCASATPTVVSSIGATNSSTTGGGMGASAFLPLVAKKLDFGIKATAGDGIGRYGAAQIADATAKPDGTLALIRNAQGLVRLEWHPSPKLDVYGYYGLEYGWRAGYTGYELITITKTTAIPANGTNPAIPATTATSFKANQIGGYGNRAANNSGCATEGVPTNDFNPSSGSNCAGDIRIIQEGTLGFWHKLYQGEKGRMQWGLQYSYLTKSAWSGTGGVAAGGTPISPKGINNIFMTSFRYYLP